jgi:O-methyltransferase domain/Dimerisation domain
MIMGVAQTAVLCTAAQLGLADHLKDGPTSVAALAEATGTHPPTLARLLDVLIHLGLCAEPTPGQFTCTPLGALLQTDAPHSLRHIAMLMGGEWYGPTWPQLAHSVQTGTSTFEAVVGMPVYRYVQQHPAMLAVFQQAMSDLSTQEGLAICEAYDFSGARTVVDVGGGRGGLLALLLEAFPSLTGILMDMPAVVEGAHTVFDTETLRGRCQLVGGDFLTAVPAGGDLYLLKRILVDRTDDEARTLLRNIRRAMAPQGRVLVADPDSRSPYGKLYDMLMLMVFGSRLRTDADVQALFAQTGFTLSRAIETRAVTTLRLLEGVPA